MNVLIIVVAAVLLVLVIALVPHFTSNKATGNNQPPFQLATAAIQSFPVTETGSGTVVPASEVGVNFTTSGQLASIAVHIGQQVAAGTTLAQLNSATAEADVARAESAVASAGSVYNQTVSSAGVTASNDAATVTGDNQKLASDQATLAADDCSATQPSNALVCQDDQAAITADQAQIRTDQARQQRDAAAGQLAISQAQSGVTSANTQLTAANAELANLTLVAPSAGTVLQINGQVGGSVGGTAAGGTTLPGSSTAIPEIAGVGSPSGSGAAPLFVLGNPNDLVVGAAFPATDEPQLAAGQHGTITDTSLNGLDIPCHVLAVAPAPTDVSGTSVIYATVTPEGNAQQLYTGMSVSVVINVSQATRVLAVPQSAIYLVAGVPHADVWDGKRAIATTVETGLEGTTMIQVSSGLTAGQQVVLSAYQGLTTTPTSSGS